MSKKVVRLTESQLRLMINKVINEQKAPISNPTTAQTNPNDKQKVIEALTKMNIPAYVNYHTKSDFLVKINTLMKDFKDMQIIYEKELNDNFLYYPAKKHIVFVVASGNERYQIEVFFGEKEINKIQGLTFFKYKKES